MTIDLKSIGETAGSAVSLIIACTIFLHQLITKSVANSQRLTALTDEYRNHPDKDDRRASLADQITLYYWRNNWIRRAICTVTVGEFFFIAVIIASGLSVLIPASTAIGVVGITALLLGLVTIGIGCGLEIYENYHFKYVVDSELSDLPELPQKKRDEHKGSMQLESSAGF